MRPEEWLAGCVAAHRQLEGRLASLDDTTVAAPSALPGWTVGHLVTHLARNADAHTWVVEQAGLGQVVAMYPLGPPSRTAAIEAGAGRPATEQLADLEAAQVRLEAAWAGATDEVWRSGLGLRSAGPATVAMFVLLRWREVELHLRDLEPTVTAPAWDDLPAAYVDAELVDLTRGLPARVPDDVTLVLAPHGRPPQAYGSGPNRVVVEAPAGHIVGWLTDRVTEPGWPALRGWGY